VELPCDFYSTSDSDQFPPRLLARNNFDARPRQAQQTSEELNTGCVGLALHRSGMEFKAQFAGRVLSQSLE
jgi:hypothetical protein